MGDSRPMEVVEYILLLKPTLVICSVPYKQETVGRLLKQPLNFLAMNPRMLDDVYADIRLLGGIVGRAQAAEALVNKIQRAFAAVGRRTKEHKAKLQDHRAQRPTPSIISPARVAEQVSQ